MWEGLDDENSKDVDRWKLKEVELFCDGIRRYVHCRYLCTYMCMFYSCIYVFIHVCMYACMCVCQYRRIYIYVRVCSFAFQVILQYYILISLSVKKRYSNVPILTWFENLKVAQPALEWFKKFLVRNFVTDERIKCCTYTSSFLDATYSSLSRK